MRRYLVFAGAAYYARPGWRGFDSAWETLDEAKARGLSLLNPMVESSQALDWWQVVDIGASAIVDGAGYAAVGLGYESAGPDE